MSEHVPTHPGAGWSWQPVDGGFLHFHRDRGLNLLERGPHTREARRVAPRVLQVGLLTPCNLHCSFCYRDTRAPSLLTAPFLLELLEKAARWGVLEVAFGGGEPLLFKGFTGLVRALRERTPLGVNFTTNGTLLTPALIEALRGNVGEVRVSAYPDNGYRRSLRRLAEADVPAGVNWLVTPENVGRVELFVHDFLASGARNVLLLGYKGADARLHLDAGHLDVLRRQLARLDGLPLRLDICWYPLLRDLPHLFARQDCGAGDEFLVITPDRAVQPCSFATTRVPFATFEELRALWEDLRERREEAGVAGCTRALFRAPALPAPVPAQPEVWQWEAHASNNSGDWTLVGRFERAEQAERVAQALRELARAHEAFLASPAGQEWLERNDYMGSIPTPPLRRFGEAHAFDWSGSEEGLWWEEDGAGAPVLTAGAVGNTVVVYHPYCMGLPEQPFRDFFTRAGAVGFGHWQYERPRVRVRARGHDASVVEELEAYVSELDGNLDAIDEYVPPWGETASDPRLGDDEDRSAMPDSGCELELETDDDRLELTLGFRNSFAGPLALAGWLESRGYTDVELEVEAGGQKPLTRKKREQTVEPRLGLFGDMRPLSERLRTGTPEEVLALALDIESPDAKVLEAVQRVPGAQRLEVGRRLWRERITAGARAGHHQAALAVAQTAGAPAADWAREAWRALLQSGDVRSRDLVALAACVGLDEAHTSAAAWVRAAPGRQEQMVRLQRLAHALHGSRTLDLVEVWWAEAGPDDTVTTAWKRLVAEARIDWPRARAWLERGRPWRLLPLDALKVYRNEGPPEDFGTPSREELVAVLERALEAEAEGAGPAVRRDLHDLLTAPGRLLRTQQ